MGGVGGGSNASMAAASEARLALKMAPKWPRDVSANVPIVRFLVHFWRTNGLEHATLFDLRN